MSGSARYLQSLTSLRGIAAVIVVLHHCSIAIPGLRETLDATYVLRPLLAGPSAVYVFFVLSGFVLYLTLEGKDGFHYPPYLAKRIARICLPLAAAILLSAALVLLIRPHPIAALSDWFNKLSWNQPVTLYLIIGHLLPIDPFRFYSLDNVIWSLVHELRISILFPLLALAVRWRVGPALAASLAIALGCWWALPRLHGFVPFQAALSLQYLFLFAAGAAMARRQEVVRAAFARPAIARLIVPLLVASLVLLSIGTGGAWEPAIWAGAILLVAICFAHAGIARALSGATAAWLGRVSYSLYLLHLLVLLTLMHLLAGIVPPALLLIAVIPLALVLAELSFRWVERPSIALGRRIAARVGHGEAARTTRST